MSTQTLTGCETENSIGFVSYGAEASKSLLELGDLTVLGRDSNCAIQLSDHYVSTRHARIERTESGFLLRDLRSRNGTFVNGVRVLEAKLADGDTLQLGHSTLKFTSGHRSAKGKEPLKSRNPQWNSTLERLDAMAQTDQPALLCGPSGTGKEVISNQLHQLSRRAQYPLVSVNCSALSESLIESELFGHIRGSFTGATHDRRGAFEAARGGTLFLDEIGDLPLALQPKLLRALENSEIRPVGSDRSIITDVRIIAATHQDLRQMVRERRFRQDLYFRLNVIRIQLPTLTSRLEDFDELIYSFAKQFRVRFSFAAIEALKQHSWPGNIRELRNLVARARAYFPGQEILVDHLKELIEPAVEPAKPIASGQLSTLKEIEIQLIQDRLVAHRGNQRRVAQDLGMPKSTLHDRIRGYGIDISRLLSEHGVL